MTQENELAVFRRTPVMGKSK